MNTFIDNVLWNFSHINWEGSAMFAIIVLSMFALFRQWHILLLTLLMIVLGWGAQDIIIMNAVSDAKIISLPLLIYCTGGGLVIILCIIAFLKTAV